jgi:hypothetical protein
MFDSNGDIRDVASLPPPLPSEEALPRNRIPSPIMIHNEELNLDYVSKNIEILIVLIWIKYNIIFSFEIQDGQMLRSRESLMKDHRKHWGAVRKKWHQRAHKNEQRFSESATILSTIFKRFLFIYLIKYYQA